MKDWQISILAGSALGVVIGFLYLSWLICDRYELFKARSKIGKYPDPRIDISQIPRRSPPFTWQPDLQFPVIDPSLIPEKESTHAQ